MNSARNLLAELQSLGVEITPNGDRLHIKAPIGAITPALRETLAGHKAELLKLLAANDRHPPRIWQFTVDSKRVTAIDHGRQTKADFLRYLHNKFGPARISDLQHQALPNGLPENINKGEFS